MKIVVNKFFLLFAFLIGTFYAVAGDANNPPTPNPTGKTNAPPPPPGAPIDDNALILLIIALLFGIYIIYKRTIKAKTSI